MFYLLCCYALASARSLLCVWLVGDLVHVASRSANQEGVCLALHLKDLEGAECGYAAAKKVCFLEPGDYLKPIYFPAVTLVINTSKAHAMLHIRTNNNQPQVI